MEEIIIIGSIITLIVIIIIIINVCASPDKTDRFKESIDGFKAQFPTFDMTNKIEWLDINRFILAEDRDRREFAYITESSCIMFRYDDVISAEMTVNDSVVKSRKSGTVTGALFGGMVAGGVGAIVGGMANGRSESASSADRISVNVTLRNHDYERIEIVCLNRDTVKAGYLWDKANDTARNILARMFRAIDITDRDAEEKKALTRPTSQCQTAADPVLRIQQVAELYRDGLLTEEEYTKLKTNLIS